MLDDSLLLHNSLFLKQSRQKLTIAISLGLTLRQRFDLDPYLIVNEIQSHPIVHRD